MDQFPDIFPATFPATTSAQPRDGTAAIQKIEAGAAGRGERERERENMAPNEDPVAAEAPAEDAPAEKEAAVAPAEETAPVTDDAAAPPPPQQPQGEEIKGFIGGLAWEVTDNELHEEFKKYNIVSAIVATDKFSGRSRCVCFPPSPP